MYENSVVMDIGVPWDLRDCPNEFTKLFTNTLILQLVPVVLCSHTAFVSLLHRNQDFTSSRSVIVRN